MALVLTNFGAYFTKDVSPDGVGIVGPPDIKDKLSLNDTIEFDIHTLHGKLLPRSVGLHCRGEVVRINEPSPHIVEVGIELEELTVLS